MHKAKSYNEWLARRKQGIGGSDVAGIFGLSNYSTPYTVWADKLGLLPEKADTDSMRLGRDLEDYVAQRFSEETGLKVRRDSRTITNGKYPYSYAHIDRRLTGKTAGLECKTCSAYRNAEFAEGEYPIEYYTQCLHYLGVTGWDTWYLAVLILDGTFIVYEVKREDVQDGIDEVQKRIFEFWESYVLTKRPPPMDGKGATSQALNEVYGESAETSIDLSALEPHCAEIAALKSEIDERERMQELHRQEIKLAMGKNTFAELGAWKASWKPNKNGVRTFKINIRRD